MFKTTPVSAYISEETKAGIEAWVKRRGAHQGLLSMSDSHGAI